MKNLWIAVVMLLFFTTCSQLEPDLSGIGEVKFQSVLVDSFSGNLPNGRIAGPSTWKHIFKNPAVMEIKNKVTGQEYKFDYNPNQFGEGIKFPLPYGSYTYKTKVSGGAFEKFLPFKAEGEFNLGVASLEVKIQATTDYGLITVKNEFVKSLGIRNGSELCDFKLLSDESFYFIYAKKGQIAKMEIIESLTEKLIKRDVSIAAYNHYNFFLKKDELNGSVNFLELALGVFEYVEEGIEIGESESETFTDPRDGQVYKIVKIGDQIWFAENLNYVISDSWCNNNDPDNCEIYGRLYNYKSVSDACPEGWHLPNMEEWGKLIGFLGGDDVAGGKMKSTTGWDEPNIGATNESGFSGLPGGNQYLGPGSFGIWWSSTMFGILDSDGYEAAVLGLGSNTGWTSISWDNVYDHTKLSCRCIKN